MTHIQKVSARIPTEQQRVFALLRTEPTLRDKTEEELRVVINEDPMLLPHLYRERVLEAQLFWPDLPPNPSKLPLPEGVSWYS